MKGSSSHGNGMRPATPQLFFRDSRGLLDERLPNYSVYCNIADGMFIQAGKSKRRRSKSTACFASMSLKEKCGEEAEKVKVLGPSKNSSIGKFLQHPLALLALVPKDFSLFVAGAVAGAAAKTVTAPLDRIKLLMQTHVVRIQETGSGKGIGFIEAITNIRKEEGIKGYWKGNLPQVMRIIPYSAVQLFAYEFYKKLFKGGNKELSVVGRLAAGACAGMTSTLVTYPLDVLRLRLAVDPACKSMSQVAINMLREEGIASFYKGLGPSLLGIAPYIAVNFCMFDLRQMQMKGSPYNTVLDAIPGIIARDGVVGLYRGFLANALKNLPNSSIRLTTFDSAKALIQASQNELEKIRKENSGCSGATH
eukprot:TRINITY_DN11382_c0_g1_i2.p1 TRINITY_DN11382_c0_g1~~TRINITY_DN11382_c0_g1_i2.p1  ORF type:complete len:364 (-),score=74.09 TRINITY_DN11382_c0_g1_i2:403-1494(-)